LMVVPFTSWMFVILETTLWMWLNWMMEILPVLWLSLDAWVQSRKSVFARTRWAQ
jgi:hypothetical protein